jgi:hypothetical protein
VDSGTSILTADSDTVAAIAASIGAKEIIAGEYLVACDYETLPDFEFTIDNKKYVLTAYDYLIPDGKNNFTNKYDTNNTYMNMHNNTNNNIITIITISITTLTTIPT